MARRPLNALQAILIRERVILYFDRKKTQDRSYSVRKLIEDIALSVANEDEADAYREEQDQEDEGQRFDSGLSLKHSAVDNFLSRRASAISDDNLHLICNFLVAEGFLSNEALALNGNHPDPRLSTQYKGIAETDPRLQRHRRALEGEYYEHAPSIRQSLWIAAPGRSRPFVTLRQLSCVNHDPTEQPAVYEGRIFLIPTDITLMVEVSISPDKAECFVHRVGVRDNAMILHHEGRSPITIERTSLANFTLGKGSRYKPAAPLKHVPSNLREAFGDPSEYDWPGARASLPEVAHHPKSPRASTPGDTPKKGWRTDEETRLDLELLRAAATGDTPALLLSLFKGASINTQDRETGRTAAHLAAMRGDLEMTQWIDDPRVRDVHELHKILPDAELTPDILKRWSNPLAFFHVRRFATERDHEQCLPSELAPISTDNSDRNRRATAVWQLLFLKESREHSVSGLLDCWTPSSAMLEAAHRYAAPLPAGFSDPAASGGNTRV